jgi:hypothetical protein
MQITTQNTGPALAHFLKSCVNRVMQITAQKLHKQEKNQI